MSDSARYSALTADEKGSSREIGSIMEEAPKPHVCQVDAAEWQKSSNLSRSFERVSQTQGIPLPAREGIRSERLCFTGVAFLLLVLPIVLKSEARVTTFVEGSDIKITARNCDVIVEDGSTVGVKVHRWRLLGSMTHRITDDGQLHVSTDMAPQASSWLRCYVSVIAPSGPQDAKGLQSLHINMRRSEDHQRVLLLGGRVHGDLTITAKTFTVIKATNTKCTGAVQLKLKTGSISLDLGQNGTSAKEWSVSSTKAPVFVRSSEAMQIKSNSKELTTLAGFSVHDNNDSFLLCTGEPHVHKRVSAQARTSRLLGARNAEADCAWKHALTFASNGDAPLYAQVGCEAISCETKRWKSEFGLSPSAKQGLEDVRRFIDSRGRRLWYASLAVAFPPGQGPSGVWTIVSNDACRIVSPTWLAILSFGVLWPETIFRTLHFEGVVDYSDGLLSDDGIDAEDREEMAEVCEKNRSDANSKLWVQTARMARMVLTQLNGTAPYGIMFESEALHDDALLFDLGRTGDLQVNLVSEVMNIPFMLAVFMNVLCAGALSIGFLMIVQTILLPFVYKRYQERNAANFASQQLHRSRAEDQWEVRARFQHFPTRSIRLYWLRTALTHSARHFQVSFAKHKLGEMCEEKSIRIHALELEEVTETYCSAVLKLDHAGIHDEGIQLVFRITAFSAANRALATSSWGAPLSVPPSRSVAQLPFIMLSTFASDLKRDEVAMKRFVEKACSKTTPPCLTLMLENVQIALDIEDVGEDFRVEIYFGDKPDFARRATASGVEKSFARSILLKPFEGVESEVKGWTGDDAVLSHSVTPERTSSFRLEPPFRDKLRFGAPLRVNVVAENGGQILGSGRIDWDDLLDSYTDSLAQPNVQLDIIDNDGDEVGGLSMCLTFASEMLQRQNLGRDLINAADNWFREDIPGDVWEQGTDRFVVWNSDKAGPEGERWSCNFWVEQLGGSKPTLVATEVRFWAETFAWVVNADFINGPYACCRLVMEVCSPEPPYHGSEPDERNVKCHSNWFIVVQTLTVAEFERAYASYCRLNLVQMTAVDESSLQLLGLETREIRVRGCSGLRQAMPFEDLKYEQGCPVPVQCSGGLLLTGFAHRVGNQSDTEKRYRLRSHKVEVIDGLNLIQTKKCWRQDFMFAEHLDFIFLVNEFVESTASSLGLHSLTGSSVIEFLWNRILWPLSKLLAKLIMHLYQLICFIWMPITAAVILLTANYLDSFQVSTVAWNVIKAQNQFYEPGSMLPRTKICLVSASIWTVLIMCALMILNGLPTSCPRLASLADTFLLATVRGSIAGIAFLLFAMMLIFLIGALLDPGRAMVPLVMVASSIGLVVSMWKQLSDLMDRISAVIESCVDTVLKTVLDGLADRIGIGEEGGADENIQEDLEWAHKQADGWFRGRDPEGEDLGKVDTDFVIEDEYFRNICEAVAKDKRENRIKLAGKGMQDKSTGHADQPERRDGAAADKGSGENFAMRKQLTALYQHYLAKSQLDEDVEWRIFEETNALTDAMVQEHKGRLQLLDFEGVGTAQTDGNKERIPKAYVVYKASFRENRERTAREIVKWADPFLQWKQNVDKVTSFYDNAVPKYVTSCALDTFSLYKSGSKTSEVLARVVKHVEEKLSQDSGATITIGELEGAVADGRCTWASCLLPTNADFKVKQKSYKIYDKAKATTFLKGVVRQILPGFRSQGGKGRIPLYKLPAIFEKLIEGRVWWSGLHAFLKEDCGFVEAEIDDGDVADGFFDHSDGTGFLNADDIPDVLMYLTDGGLWKAAAVALLRHLEVCGELGNKHLGDASDEKERAKGEWSSYIPDWPEWVMNIWKHETDETDEDPGFLQKAGVTSFVEELMFDMKDRKDSNFGNTLETFQGFSDWAFVPEPKVPGCAQAIWRYIDSNTLVPLRGLPWEAFETLLIEFDLDMPEALSRQFFARAHLHANSRDRKPDDTLFISPYTFWGVLEDITTNKRLISLAGFRNVLRGAGISLPDLVTKHIIEEMSEIKILDHTCDGLVDFNELAELVPKYLSGGLWLEAVSGLLENEEIEISQTELARRFNEIDQEGVGVLKPSQVIDLIRSLGRTGITYEHFRDMITSDMHFHVQHRQLRLIFNTVDVSNTGTIDETEFVSGFRMIVGRLMPNILLRSLQLLPEQVVTTIAGTLTLLLMIFVFLALSMSAIVPHGQGGDINNVVQSIVAGAAAFGVKAQQASGYDMQKLREAIETKIGELLPITTVAKRRSGANE